MKYCSYLLLALLSLVSSNCLVEEGSFDAAGQNEESKEGRMTSRPAAANSTDEASETGEGNLLLNGSFESPVVSSDDDHIFTVLDGWAVSFTECPGSGKIDLRAEDGMSASGSQYVELTSPGSCSGDSTVKLSQSVNVDSGKKYKISFKAARQPHTKKEVSLTVSFSDQTLLAEEVLTADWQSFSFEVEAEAATADLIFVSGQKNSFGAQIDSVSVTEIVSVPKPKSCAIEAGPIWNGGHSQQVCPGICNDKGGWTGHWWTTVWGKMSVCQCADCGSD